MTLLLSDYYNDNHWAAAPDVMKASYSEMVTQPLESVSIALKFFARSAAQSPVQSPPMVFSTSALYSWIFMDGTPAGLSASLFTLARSWASTTGWTSDYGADLVALACECNCTPEAVLMMRAMRNVAFIWGCVLWNLFVFINYNMSIFIGLNIINFPISLTKWTN